MKKLRLPDHEHEADIQSYIIKKAREAGAVAYKLGGEGSRGKPDYVIAYQGFVLFIEFKSKGEKPKPMQVRAGKKLKEQLAHYGWTDNVRDGMLLLERIGIIYNWI